MASELRCSNTHTTEHYVFRCDLPAGHTQKHYHAAGLQSWGVDQTPAPTQSEVVLTYKNGQRQLLIDGQHVKGVRSTKIVVDANDVPHVLIDLVPASIRAELDRVSAAYEESGIKNTHRGL